jgi:O-antigen/teichoic acid export membrane protein
VFKKVLKNSFIYSIAGLFSGGAIFLLLPIYTRSFSIKDYGVFEYLSIIGTLVGVTVALEIHQAVARFSADFQNNKVQMRIYASTAFLFTLGMHIFVIILIALFGKYISAKLLGDSNYSFLLFTAALSFAFSGLVNLLVTQLQWELKAKESALISIFSSFGIFVVTIFLVWVLKWGLIGSYFGTVISGIIIIPLGIWFAGGSFGFVFSIEALKKMLNFSFPLVFSSVGWVLSGYLDRLAIKQLLTYEDVAVFGVGFRIAGIVMLLITGINGAVSPAIYSLHHESETRDRIATMFRLFFTICIVFCGAISMFSPELIYIFATPDYLESVLVIPSISLSIMFSRLYIFAPGLGIAKKTVLYAILNVSMGVLNFVLNYLLIPIIGILGASLATLISTSLLFILIMFKSQSYYFVPHKFKPIILFSVFAFFIMMFSSWTFVNFKTEVLNRIFLFGLLCILPLITNVFTLKDLIRYRNLILVRLSTSFNRN